MTEYTSYDISTLRFGETDYTIHDANAHTKIGETNNTLSKLKTSTDNTLSAMSTFKAKTESFLNTVKCEVKTIQDSDYELELNLKDFYNILDRASLITQSKDKNITIIGNNHQIFFISFFINY